MTEFEPVLFDEVAAVLRNAGLRRRRPLGPTAPGRAMPDYTPGFWLVQDGPTKVTVYWNGRSERYRLERLDKAAEALESAGFGVGRFADAPRFWLDVFRRSEIIGRPGEEAADDPT